MTEMASRLCRSWDVFLKRPLIGRPKNCLTNCINQCDSQKIEQFKPKCRCEVVPIWEKNKTSTNRPCLRTTFSAKCKPSELLTWHRHPVYLPCWQRRRPFTRLKLRCQPPLFSMLWLKIDNVVKMGAHLKTSLFSETCTTAVNASS